MSETEKDPQPMPTNELHSVVVMCENCGEIIDVKDVRAYLLSIHLMESCPQLRGLRSEA